jgi:hypothetical protein
MAKRLHSAAAGASPGVLIRVFVASFGSVKMPGSKALRLLKASNEYLALEAAPSTKD